MNAMKTDWTGIDINRITKTPLFMYHGDEDIMVKMEYAEHSYQELKD
jgi:predicted esterase